MNELERNGIIFRPNISPGFVFHPNPELILELQRDASFFNGKPFHFLKLDDIYQITDYFLKNFIPRVELDAELKSIMDNSLDIYEKNGFCIIQSSPMEFDDVANYCCEHKIPFGEETVPEEGIYTEFAVSISGIHGSVISGNKPE